VSGLDQASAATAPDSGRTPEKPQCGGDRWEGRGGARLVRSGDEPHDSPQGFNDYRLVLLAGSSGRPVQTWSLRYQ
jgi:hypothetical protein